MNSSSTMRHREARKDRQVRQEREAREVREVREAREETMCCSCCSDSFDQIDINIHDSYCSKGFLLILRLVCFIVLGARFYLNLTNDYTSAFVMIQFLTHFGFILTLLFYSTVICDFLLNRVRSNGAPKLKRDVSILYQIALCLEVPITALYWFVIYDGTNNTAWDFVKDAGNHGFPLLALFLDLLFNLIPFQVRHLFVVLATGLFYLGVNLAYTLAVAPVYTVIDWKSTNSYVYAVIAFATIGIVHCFGQLIWYKCKQGKAESMGSDSESNKIISRH